MVFEWDDQKDRSNRQKHGVTFMEARRAFEDPDRLIYPDEKHSLVEKRYFCYGMVDGSVLTVRFTIRRESIRIIGAEKWRKGAEEYEKR